MSKYIFICIYLYFNSLRSIYYIIYINTSVCVHTRTHTLEYLHILTHSHTLRARARTHRGYI